MSQSEGRGALSRCKGFIQVLLPDAEFRGGLSIHWGWGWEWDCQLLCEGHPRGVFLGPEEGKGGYAQGGWLVLGHLFKCYPCPGVIRWVERQLVLEAFEFFPRSWSSLYGAVRCSWSIWGRIGQCHGGLSICCIWERLLGSCIARGCNVDSGDNGWALSLVAPLWVALQSLVGLIHSTLRTERCSRPLKALYWRSCSSSSRLNWLGMNWTITR